MLIRLGTMRAARPVGKTYYVSSVAANGYALGNNANTGLSKGVPLLTLAAAQTAASDGDRVVINGTAATPFSATLLTLTKSLTWSIDPALSVGDVILSNTSTTTRAVDINAPGKSIVLDGLKLDADLAAGPESGLIQMISNAASDAVSLTLRNCNLSDWTTLRAIFQQSSGVKGNITFENCTFATAGNCQSAIELFYMISGVVTVRNCNITLSAQNATGKGGIVVSCHSTAVDGAVQALIEDNTVAVTWNSGGTFTGPNYGIYVENVRNAVVRNNPVTMAGAFTDGSARDSQGEAIVITPNPTGTQLDSGGFDVSGNTLNMQNKNGMGIRIGQDDASVITAGKLDGGVLTLNTVTGSADNEAVLHGIFINKTDAIVTRNTVDRAMFGIGDKEADGALVANNVFKRCTGSGIRLKGAQNGEYAHNTVILSSGYDGVGIEATANTSESPETTTTGCTAHGNLVIRDGGTGEFVSVDTGQGLTLSANSYHDEGGSGTPGNPWIYQGSSYANLAAWQAIEATANATDPGLTGYPGSLVPTSAATVARDADVLTDFNGALRNDPTAVGAYEDA